MEMSRHLHIQEDHIWITRYRLVPRQSFLKLLSTGGFLESAHPMLTTGAFSAEPVQGRPGLRLHKEGSRTAVSPSQNSPIPLLMSGLRQTEQVGSGSMNFSSGNEAVP